MDLAYEPETTPVQRELLIAAVKDERQRDALQALLRDLDRAEQVIRNYRAFLHKEGYGR